ncbi:MAG: ribonucleoside-diphosphate reductase subunit alpha [Planctomycetota bacterium]|nr:ribonucleoside-diphosphate reductase subunit alpha [Planctomycetota bacterium]
MLKVQQDIQVQKRDGRLVSFDNDRICVAIQKAFCAEQQLDSPEQIAPDTSEKIATIVDHIASQLSSQGSTGQGVEVEAIQDLVERELMRYEFFSVARRYILYRAEHTRMRRLRDNDGIEDGASKPGLMVNREGELENFDSEKLQLQIKASCLGLEDSCDSDVLLRETQKQFFDGISPREIAKAMVASARSKIEVDPSYDIVASRLTLNIIYREALGKPQSQGDLLTIYRERFENYIDEGIEAKRLDPKLKAFDLDLLASVLEPDRDSLFPYLGLQTIYDRYLLHIDGRRIEAPQYFWMRVAMGLALQEGEDKSLRAIEFYHVLSNFRFISATPTLFNAGTCHPQLSSCYLSTVTDDLDHIFKVIGDNAKLSKWAGGLGNDWTNIRATNAHIKGTNGKSQGVIPFLKVVSDTAVAVNQGGKRKGAVCSYLESWHFDIEEFLELRKNTGDDRRRTHDMHTANWIPDLFMKRVINNQTWTLFSPEEVPDLHDLVGSAFEKRYEHYEQMAREGKVKLHKEIPAVDLWRKMLTRLFETGHPWITWKDPSNLRSPQDHTGVVHSSNLCTEILLNTSQSETAVCNLGSVNLLRHCRDGKLDRDMLKETIDVAVRMLDNVIDINYYPTEEAKNSNQAHRPVGLGLMGFQDALAACGISYSSEEAVQFADESMEAISYYSIMASSRLADERGKYSSYDGSKWDRGLLPIDTIDVLEAERGVPVEMDRSSTMDWDLVRQQVAQHGMRNSNVMAIAPTATISTIIGVTQSIEPNYSHLFVKSNLSGEFTQVNINLVNELKSRNLWNDNLREELKYHDGTLKDIQTIPQDIKDRYQTSFEIDPKWLVECASRRQKWIDMGQSLNLYMGEPSGKKLDEMYRLAWRKGLKTTYYLRCLGATQVEKSTLDINKFGVQPKWMKNQSSSSEIEVSRETKAPNACSIMDPDCEACQ